MDRRRSARRPLRAASAARPTRKGSRRSLGGGRLDRRRRQHPAQIRRKTLFHVLGLGAENRLAHGAELAGQRYLDRIADAGLTAEILKRGRRRGTQAADDADRRAFDPGFDQVRPLHPQDLDGDFEPEAQIRDLGLERRRVMGPVDLGEIADTVDAPGEGPRVLHFVEDGLAPSRYGDLTVELHRNPPRPRMPWPRVSRQQALRHSRRENYAIKWSTRWTTRRTTWPRSKARCAREAAARCRPVPARPWRR